MKYTKQTSLEILTKYQFRYAAVRNKKARITLLNEFFQLTGFERKYATKLLKKNRTYKPFKGRSLSYGKEDVDLVVECWNLLDQPCGKHLKVTLQVAICSLLKQKTGSCLILMARKYKK